jgi:hypothetical protein
MRRIELRGSLVLAILLGLGSAVAAGAQEAPAEAPLLPGEAPLADPSLRSVDLRSVPYEASLGRDPFDLPDYSEGTKRSTAELDLRSALLVGIVRLPGGGYIALVEDENGDSYALAKGDPIEGGSVTGIDEAALIAWMRNGDSRQQIRLELAKEGE